MVEAAESWALFMPWLLVQPQAVPEKLSLAPPHPSRPGQRGDGQTGGVEEI